MNRPLFPTTSGSRWR